jgi:peptidoglycan/LPS O-acetylase OafA/YrhL
MLFFLAVAVSRHFEKATTPHSMGDFVHFDLRKLFSIAVFAIVGLLLAAWRRRGARDTFRIALMVAGYSAIIEIVQRLHGEHEGLYWNTIDVLCGFLGGFLGSAAYALAARASRTPAVPSDPNSPLSATRASSR